MAEIKAKTASEAWKKMLKFIMSEGDSYKDGRDKICKETINLIVTVENMAGILAPLDSLSKSSKWVYPSAEEIKKSILYKDNSSEYYYNYGKRAFYMDRINQIDDYVIPLLKKSPMSKRAIVIFFAAKRDTLPLRKEIPGVIMIDFVIRNNKLCSTMVIRSNDMFYGWPANIAQAYFLTKYVADELNYPIGTITTFSNSAHIFEEQFDDIKKIVGKGK